MKILLLQVGKTKERAYLDIENEFLKRLGPFCDLQTVTVKTSDQTTENADLQGKIPDDYTVVALDSRGKEMSSENFAHWIREQRDFKGARVAFLIGGPHGFTNDTLKRAHVILSLSDMTFTHQMVRLFLLEQIYRAFTIIAGKTYHY